MSQWWKERTGAAKLAWGAVALNFASHIGGWLFDNAAQMAYQSLLGSVFKPEKAAKMSAAISSYFSSAAAFLGAPYTRGILTGALFLALVIILGPPTGRWLRRQLSIFDALRRMFLAKAGKHRQIARLGHSGKRLALIGLEIISQANAYEAHPLWGKEQLSEDEKKKIWFDYIQKSSDKSNNNINRFRSEVMLEARSVLEEMHKLGYIAEVPREVNHITNAFCMEKIVHALGDGSEAIFRELRSFGFTEDQIQSFAPQ